jgi:serine/threonine-protein kinase RsbW
LNSGQSVSYITNSDIDAVDAAESLVRQFASSLGFDEAGQDYIALAAREIIINAIKHGNRFHPAKHFTIQLSRTPTSFVIEVTDQGDGFQLENVPDPHLPENLHRRSGRGLNLALAIMDEFALENGGTRVRIAKRLPAPDHDST